MYGGGGDNDGDRRVRSGGMDCDCSCAERTDLALDSVSDPYSEVEEILVGDSRHSSCSVYTVYWLLLLNWLLS